MDSLLQPKFLWNNKQANLCLPSQLWGRSDVCEFTAGQKTSSILDKIDVYTVF